MTNQFLLAIFAVAGLMLFAARPARAGDGVLEIDQSCVSDQHSCFSDGRTGLPILLLQPGSYRLTSDIVVTDVTTDALRMSKGTTLDLGGFTIKGPASCTGAPAVCTGIGSGVGIRVSDGYSTIRNGRITGFGDDGIRGNTGLRVENVVLDGNGGDGIDSQGTGVQIVGCTALRNGHSGFYAAYQAGQVMLIGNVARGNGFRGFDVANALLLDNAAHQNGAVGINAAYQDTDSAVARNVASGNGTGVADDQVDGGFRFGPNVCGAAACP